LTIRFPSVESFQAMATTTGLPLAQTLRPTTASEVAAALRDAHESAAAVYPLGGQTALDFGLAAKTPGVGLSLARLDRVVDYPARDMTITVEAGITLGKLAATLAESGQRLPIDAPHAAQATLGGLIATNHSGPLRYSQGTIRDYVIGISAVDGAGRPFRGGGRVVKNVAGYDFCKLLVGSLGTLGIITQMTLKVKPITPASTMLVCELADWEAVEPLLARLVTTAITPAFIELLYGPAWSASAPRVVVGMEGSATEVDWMRETLRNEAPEHDWRDVGPWHGAAAANHAASGAANYDRLVHFTADPPQALTLKLAARPSALVRLAQLVLEIDSRASLQAHAGNGILLAQFADFPAAVVSRDLIGRLQPAAVAAGGHAVVLSAANPQDLTRQTMWGNVEAPGDLMRAVKQQFDPRGVLNPGRFVY
jgi:glycolate oxidase FAD binding subunit